MSKKWYLSKALWFNFLTGVLAVLALPEFVALVPSEALQYLAMINAVGNMLLRLITSERLTT